MVVVIRSRLQMIGSKEQQNAGKEETDWSYSFHYQYSFMIILMFLAYRYDYLYRHRLLRTLSRHKGHNICTCGQLRRRCILTACDIAHA